MAIKKIVPWGLVCRQVTRTQAGDYLLVMLPFWLVTYFFGVICVATASISNAAASLESPVRSRRPLRLGLVASSTNYTCIEDEAAPHILSVHIANKKLNLEVHGETIVVNSPGLIFNSATQRSNVDFAQAPRPLFSLNEHNDILLVPSWEAMDFYTDEIKAGSYIAIVLVNNPKLRYSFKPLTTLFYAWSRASEANAKLTQLVRSFVSPGGDLDLVIVAVTNASDG